MWKLVKQLLSLLSREQRRRFYRLQVLVLLMAFAEIIGVASIGPFMALVGNKGLLYEENKIGELYRLSGFAEPHEFIFFAGVLVLVILAISAAVSMFTTWRLSLFSTKIGSEIGDRLYQYYMYQPWLFHTSGSSSQLTKKISSDSNRVTSQIITPLMQMNAKLVFATLMLVTLFAFNPVVAITAIVIFLLAYAVLYRFVRNKLAENGRNISMVSTQRYKLMAEGFGGIKDVLLLGRQSVLISKFQQSGKVLSYSQGTNQALAQTPRYFMEFVAYSAVIFLVLYLIKSYNGDLAMILPVLAVYALAGFKLLPAFQQIYTSIASIKGGMAAFESIRQELLNSEDTAPVVTSEQILKPQESIELNNIVFAYPGKLQPALDGVNICIPVNKTVGIVGPTGSGKSTAIDLILGLIQPDSGMLAVDGKQINHSNLRAWQNALGYVAQSIFLSDATILENIAFGLPQNEIDIERAKLVIKLAHLEELINELPDGLNTRVGERGVQLSGGQRQRIGISRALYNDASVLVFDEATSALDGITEKLIMDAIHELAGSKTIIMIAHRLKTVEKCDVIYFISKGKVLDSGTFDELVERNPVFRKMANHA